MVNFEIKAEYVNVVGLDDGKLKKMKLRDAVDLAEDNGEDVILLSDKEEIPVVKIGDYKKFLYEKKKKEQDNKKKARLNSQETKEVRIGSSIDTNDLKIKANTISRILKEGDKVAISIKFRGREARLINNGLEMMKQLDDMLSIEHKVDKQPYISGNQVFMVVSPNKKIGG